MVRRRRCRHDSNPFLLILPAEPLQRAPRSPEQPASARGPPAAAELHVSPPKQGENSSPESFYWHPCRASASPLSARERAMHEFRGQRCFIETFPARTEPGTAHADSAFPTRHPPEHRHDSQALRLSGRGRPYHRTGRLSRLRPAFPPGGNGLPRSGQHHPPRLVVEIRAMARGTGLPPAADSPPKGPPITAISVTRRRTSCYSGARAPASPTRWSRPRTRGW
ncbi:hypothetical protein ACVWZZ_006464 [Bradyrhizobium sp. LM6.10]